jgi:hypothetical protein
VFHDIVGPAQPGGKLESMARVAPQPSARAAVRRTRFFVGFAVATLMLVLIGFARTVYLRPWFGAVDGPTGSPALPWHLVLHGVVMTAWFAFVLLQTLLIRQKTSRFTAVSALEERRSSRLAFFCCRMLQLTND